MHNFKKIFLDSTPIIYFIQHNEFYFEQVAKIFSFFSEADVKIISSDIVTAESIVHAYRYNNLEVLNNFDNLMNLLNVEIIHTSEKIARKTSQIRAKYRSFETPDAFNLATAVLSDCDIFLTNDKRLKKFDEVQCLLVDDFNFGDEK